MRSVIQGVFVGAALVSMGPGCDWRKLEKAVDKAPVLSVSAPGGYLGNDVGRLVVALPPPAESPTVSARFFMASITKVSAAVVDLDAQGKPTVYNVPDSVLAPLTSATIGSVALATRPDEAFASVLLGVPQYKTGEFKNGGMFRLKIQPGATAPVFVLELPLLPPAALVPGNKAAQFTGIQGYGRGVASGAVSGNPGFDDWVVVGNAGVALIEDGVASLPQIISPASLCGLDHNPLRLDHLYEFSRTPAIADLIPSVPGGEIAVGVPDATGVGKVVILSREAAGALGCPIIISVAGNPGFGTSVVAGDVNGDAISDLVVGSPPSNTFVFFGPFVPGVAPVPSLTIPAPATATAADFGARTALMEFDAVPGPELIVAAPGFASGATPAAGAVFAFKADGTLLPLVIADHDPDESSNLGEGLAIVPFRNAGCAAGAIQSVIVAGGNEEVFTYFKLPGALPDPRCFPAK